MDAYARIEATAPTEPQRFGTPAPRHICKAWSGCGRTLLGFLATLSAGLPTVFAAVTVVVLVSLFPATVEGQGDPEPCSGDGLYNPTPTAIEIGAVPIVVESTTADYFVLYVTHDVDGTEVKIPVLVKKGAAGTTTLAENVEALPASSMGDRLPAAFFISPNYQFWQ